MSKDLFIPLYDAEYLPKYRVAQPPQPVNSFQLVHLFSIDDTDDVKLNLSNQRENLYPKLPLNFSKHLDSEIKVFN